MKHFLEPSQSLITVYMKYPKMKLIAGSTLLLSVIFDRNEISYQNKNSSKGSVLFEFL